MSRFGPGIQFCAKTSERSTQRSLYVGEISAPTFLSHGEQDRVVQSDRSRELALALEDSKKRVSFYQWPHDGHDPVRDASRRKFYTHLEHFPNESLGRQVAQTRTAPGESSSPLLQAPSAGAQRRQRCSHEAHHQHDPGRRTQERNRERIERGNDPAHGAVALRDEVDTP